jgi:hypothetical protein
MAESACIVRSFRVGKRTCTMTIQAPQRGRYANITAEWEPTIPNGFTKKELRQYRTGRDAIAVELAMQMGGAALVVEA